MFKKIISILILFSFLLFTSFAAVEVFTHYNTLVKINSNNTIEVNKIMNLRNVHRVGIVPGQVEFKISRDLDTVKGKITSYSVEDRYGKKINSQLRETENYSVISLDIYTPILPGFEYIINLSYTMNFEQNGFIFSDLEIPLNEVNKIPIKNGTLTIILPQNKYVTYLEDKSKYKVNKNKIVIYFNEDSPKTIGIEYSYLPIIVGNYKGSLVFLLVLNLILILLLINSVRKEIKKIKNKDKK